MKKSLIVIVVALAALSCTKESDTPTTPEPEISTTEFEALKKDVEELKQTIANLTPTEQTPTVSVAEFEKLQQENEELKATVAKLTADFFEVDGLRFNKNGSVVSTAKIEATTVTSVSPWTLTVDRTYDTEGRLIQTYGKYTGGNSIQSPPYYWQKIMYEYNGMTVKKTTQTSKSGMAAGTPYIEDISETTYW